MYKQSPYKISNEHLITEDVVKKKFKKNVVNLPPLGRNKVDIKRLTTSRPFTISEGFVGGGAYGKAYKVVNTREMNEKILTSFENSTGKIVSSFPSIGTEIVIKIAKQHPDSGTEDFFEDSLRENLIHKNLSESPSCALVPKVKPVCVSEYVPEFYMSFITKNNSKYESVTVMSNAGDTTLHKALPELSQSQLINLYVQVERAICSMWLAGYVHADLHASNIMVTKKDNNPKIIDFGFGIVLPESFKKQIAFFISTIINSGSNRSLAEVWTKIKLNGNNKTLSDYSNKIIFGRKYPGYNPESRILKGMWNKISPSNRKLLPKIRSAAWGASSSSILNKSNIIDEKTNTMVNARGLPMKTVAPGKLQKRSPSYKPAYLPSYKLHEYDPNTAVNARGLPMKTVAPGKLQKRSPSYKPAESSSYKPPEYSLSNRSRNKSLSSLLAYKPAPIPHSYKPAYSPSYKLPEYDPNTAVNERGLPMKTVAPSKLQKRSLSYNPTESLSSSPYWPGKYATKSATLSKSKNSANKHVGKVNKKGRAILKNEQGRTHVLQDGKKIYVHRMFSPSALEPSLMKNTGKVDKKKRTVFKDSKDRKYVKEGGKKVYVSRVYAQNEEPKQKLRKKPGALRSPPVETGKVDKKGRDVFKNSDNRTYVLQDGKKIYVSRMFSPSALEPSLMKNTGKVDKKKRTVFKDSKDRKYVKEGGKKIYVHRAYNKNT
jgi:serine/threonine protein kinase